MQTLGIINVFQNFANFFLRSCLLRAQMFSDDVSHLCLTQISLVLSQHSIHLAREVGVCKAPVSLQDWLQPPDLLDAKDDKRGESGCGNQVVEKPYLLFLPCSIRLL